MKSIRNRLMGNFLLIITITVVILEVFILAIIRQNYYKSLEDNLFNQIRLSSELYTKYFSDTSLEDNVLNNVDTFWKQTSAQVQIYDKKGGFLMDSLGLMPNGKTIPSDISKAIANERGMLIRDDVMSVAYPLKSSDGRIQGVIRFIASTKDITLNLRYIVLLFSIIGVLVILSVGFLGYFLSKSIVDPLKDVTRIARVMAGGNFKAKCNKKYDDEIGKLADTLNFMADEIIKKDRIKNDFISSISHELRTPLTSIKGWAVTLKETNYEDTELLLDGLNIIEKESDRLTNMVEELLDFSKFVSGRIVLKKEPVNVAEIAAQIKKEMDPRAERENIKLDMDIAHDIPEIISDGNRLKQLFINLLDNSLKFTEPGGEIEIKGEMINNFLVFSIKDTGCGIPEDEIPKVKEKFYKGKNSKSQNGIGLSICDEIIKLMNGTFDIKSQVGKGTEVIITIPIQENLI